MSSRLVELVSMAQIELTYSSPSVSNHPTEGVPYVPAAAPMSSVKLVARQTSPTLRQGQESERVRRSEISRTHTHTHIIVSFSSTVASFR